MAQETPSAARPEPIGLMWRLLAAPETLVALMGLVALVLILASLIPQLPAEAMESPQVWLSAQSGLARQQDGLLRSLGLSDLYHSLGFRILLALSGICLFVRAIESGELAWGLMARGRTMGQTQVPDGPVAWGRKLLRTDLTLPETDGGAAMAIREYLTRRGYWSVDVRDSNASGQLAGRRTALLWAWPVLYAGMLVALVGLAITDTWGWVGQQWQPIPGESRALGQGTPYILRLDAFEVQMEDGRALCDCSSQVTWFEGTAELGSDLVRVGWPASRSRVAVRQIGFVPVIRMRGWDDEGRPLTLETDADALSVTGVAEIRFTSPQSQPLVLVTGHDLFLSLSFEPNCGTGNPELYLSRIDTGGATQSQVGTLHESGTIFVDDLQLDIDLSFVPILRSDFRPGRGAVVAGLALAIIAGLWLWLAPPRLIWIREGEQEAEGKTVQVIALAPAGDSAWWHRLVSECQKVSSHDA